MSHLRATLPAISRSGSEADFRCPSPLSPLSPLSPPSPPFGMLGCNIQQKRKSGTVPLKTDRVRGNFDHKFRASKSVRTTSDNGNRLLSTLDVSLKSWRKKRSEGCLLAGKRLNHSAKQSISPGNEMHETTATGFEPARVSTLPHQRLASPPTSAIFLRAKPHDRVSSPTEERKR